MRSAPHCLERADFTARDLGGPVWGRAWRRDTIQLAELSRLERSTGKFREAQPKNASRINGALP
jgi:hypothetical protein